jgi:hypothetical protein
MASRSFKSLVTILVILSLNAYADTAACDSKDAPCGSNAAPASLLQKALRSDGKANIAQDNTVFQARTLPIPDFAERYLKLVEMGVTGSLTDEAGSIFGDCHSMPGPFNASARENGQDWPPYGHTMVGHKRLQNLRMAIEETIANNIPGDFAELGVWRGGTCIYAKALYDVYQQKSRYVHVFDVFGEVPSFSKANAAYEECVHILAVSEEAVRHNFIKYGAHDDNVKFHKGLFKDTLPTFTKDMTSGNIAVLRIDGNFYDSYQDSLYYLYPMVPIGGIIIFDDVMADPAAMQAWLDFKADNGLTEELTRVDDSSTWFRKTADIKTDPVRRPYKDCNK